MSDQRPSAPPAPAKRSGCGCGRGCLIALLVCLVLLVGGGVAGHVYGRPWLAGRLPAWEAQQPLLTLALDYTGLRERLTPPVDTERLQRSRQEGENARDRLPADLVIHPSPAAETFNVSAAQVTAFQRVAEPLEAVQAHLADGMAAQGWSLLLERSTDQGVQLGWAKEQRNCQVELVTSGPHTEVWLRSSGAS
ncbi:MAG: hypothetical protein GX657_07060 [Chloroflexi bacterium]|nr:hypothetical protein [Chloroflexota bacterium]